MNKDNVNSDVSELQIQQMTSRVGGKSFVLLIGNGFRLLVA